jgi:hypothetical protein
MVLAPFGLVAVLIMSGVFQKIIFPSINIFYRNKLTFISINKNGLFCTENTFLSKIKFGLLFCAAWFPFKDSPGSQRPADNARQPTPGSQRPAANARQPTPGGADSDRGQVCAFSQSSQNPLFSVNPAFSCAFSHLLRSVAVSHI